MPAAAEQLDYDMTRIDPEPARPTLAARSRVASEQCAGCTLGGDSARAAAATGSKLNAVSGGVRLPSLALGELLPLPGAAKSRRAKLPSAQGWNRIDVQPEGDEDVAMTLGVAMIDEQNVAMDSLARSRSVDYPSTRLLAGVRVKLRPTPVQ